jgi:ABC-type Fe3+/spermidine/putrescine transport system ATPase subunit
MSEPILELREIRKRFGRTVPADGISLALDRGEFFTMLGPSGSGKSTVLRIIAGLEQADSGSVLLDGKDVSRVPPWARHLGMVFQQYANFPHLSVARNVSYGLRRAGLDRSAVAARVAELLRLVGLAGFEERRVTQLSGGEQQRVAIARALAPRPVLLLLDEPLAALDEKIRREMQEELKRIHAETGTTFVYVTHDQEEALTMSDRVAVLNRGRCAQLDAPEPLFRRPRTRFVAGFFRGCNVVETTVEGGRLLLAGVPLPLPAGTAGPAPKALAVRGEAIRLGPDAARYAIVLPSRVEAVTYRGLYHEYRFRLADGQAVAAVTTEPQPLVEGDAAEIGVAAEDLVPLEED